MSPAACSVVAVGVGVGARVGVRRRTTRAKQMQTSVAVVAGAGVGTGRSRRGPHHASGGVGGIGRTTTTTTTTLLGTTRHPVWRRRNEHRTTMTTTTTQMRAITDSSSAEGIPTPTTPPTKAFGRSTNGGSGGNDGDDEEMLFGLPRERVFKPFAILLSSQFILFIGVGALLPALPLYAQSIGLDGTANGIVLSAPALAMLLLNLPAGRLVDSWGRKQMMMAGMFVIALSDLATSQCRTVMALAGSPYRRHNIQTSKH